MAKFVNKVSYRTYSVLIAVILFAVTIAIPRFGEFILDSDEYKLISIKESVQRGLGGSQVFNFATSSGQDQFSLSQIVKQPVILNGRKFELLTAENGVILNGEALVLKNEEKTLVGSENGYVEFSSSDYSFHDELIFAPSGVTGNTASFSSSSRRAPTSGLVKREINFRAYSAPDFSSNRSDEEILSAIAKQVYLANQYLKAVNLSLVLKEVKVFRDHQGFNEAINLKDPYKMLERTADEHNLDFRDFINISGVFSNTFFSRANGLAYSNTSCINPHYSVLFVTQGSSSLASEFNLSSTLAHEVGHIVGMSHDSNLYPDLGMSVMAQTSSMFPFGFSGQSIDEQRQFSSIENPGGRCLLPSEQGIDSDQDDISDQLEGQYGTDANDPGSYPAGELQKAYASWNGFKGQTSVGEVLGGNNSDNELNINIRNLNGESISEKRVTLEKSKEFDFIFSDLLPEFRDTYGTIEISSTFGSFSGLANTYAHTGQYGSFNYISKQKFFKGSRFQEQMTFNSFVPYSFPEGSQSLNWLSVVNLNSIGQEFEIFRISMDGQFIGKELVQVPGMGRRDIAAGGELNISAGSVLVRPKNFSKKDILFHSFISRYYVKPGSNLGGSVIVDGAVGSDVDRVFMLDDDLIQSDKQSNTWLEVVNTSQTSGVLTLSEFREEGQAKQNRLALKAYQTLHLPLLTAGLIGYKISATIPYSAVALRYKGERQVSTVQRFIPHEYLKGTLSGSLNTFLSSSSFLYVIPESPTKASLSCEILNGTNSIKRQIALKGSLINKVSLEGLFPETVKDNYYKISCALTEDQKAVMFIGRIVDSKHASLEAME